jgi:myo-inositol-1(or 4)-monophosphatase
LNSTRSFEAAWAAVQEAGRILRKGFRSRPSYQQKGAIDLVTEWDLKSQEHLISRLKSSFPKRAFLAEETLNPEIPSGPYWVVDPLDGTTNFVHGFPFYCISLALVQENRLLLGLVHNPESKKTYWAVKGKGAYCNGQPVRISSVKEISRSLLATGFPYSIRKGSSPIMKRFRQVTTQAQGVRRPGSAALDLCWVAQGIFDGFWEEQLKPWDTAAGVLIVEEAGGKVTDFKGGPYNIFKKEILASNGLIHPALTNLLHLNR